MCLPQKSFVQCNVVLLVNLLQGITSYNQARPVMSDLIRKSPNQFIDSLWEESFRLNSKRPSLQDKLKSTLTRRQSTEILLEENGWIAEDSNSDSVELCCCSDDESGVVTNYIIATDTPPSDKRHTHLETENSTTESDISPGIGSPVTLSETSCECTSVHDIHDGPPSEGGGHLPSRTKENPKSVSLSRHKGNHCWLCGCVCVQVRVCTEYVHNVVLHS